MESELHYKGVTGTVEYSAEDGCLFGRLNGVEDLVSYEGDSATELRSAFEQAVDHYLGTCGNIAGGNPAPQGGAG